MRRQHISHRQVIAQGRRRLLERLRTFSRSPLMRGTIVERTRRCGRSRCACADDPAKRHLGKVLTVHLDGRTQTLALRAEDEPGVRGAIDAYNALWQLVNDLTACEVADLRYAAAERRRGRARRRG